MEYVVALHEMDYWSDDYDDEDRALTANQRIQQHAQAEYEMASTVHHDASDGEGDWVPAGSTPDSSSSMSDGDALDAAGTAEDVAAFAAAAAMEARVDEDMDRQRAAATRYESLLERWAAPAVACTPPVPNVMPLSQLSVRFALPAPPRKDPGIPELQCAGLLADGDLVTHPHPDAATMLGRISGGAVHDCGGGKSYLDPSQLLSAWLGSPADGWGLVVNDERTLAQCRAEYWRGR